MSATSKKIPPENAMHRSFWEGFRSAFDFMGAGDTSCDHIPLGEFPKIAIDVQFTDGFDSDLANLNSDLVNLTADAKAGTMKVLSKRSS